MAILIWIVLILAILCLAVAWTRAGVLLSLEEGLLTVRVKIGPVSFQAVPGKNKPEAAEQTAKPPEKEAASPKKPGLPKPSWPELRNLLQTMWPPLKQALARTRRSIRISPLQASVVVGGEEDPAEAAQLYGELHGAVWAVMPVLEELVRVQDPWIHLDVNFEARETAVRGKAGVSLRIGSAIRIAMGLAIPGIRWFLAYRKRQLTMQPSEPAAAGSVN